MRQRKAPLAPTKQKLKRVSSPGAELSCRWRPGSSDQEDHAVPLLQGAVVSTQRPQGGYQAPFHLHHLGEKEAGWVTLSSYLKGTISWERK